MIPDDVDADVVDGLEMKPLRRRRRHHHHIPNANGGKNI